jgi:hypothetical protein
VIWQLIQALALFRRIVQRIQLVVPINVKQRATVMVAIAKMERDIVVVHHTFKIFMLDNCTL